MKCCYFSPHNEHWNKLLPEPLPAIYVSIREDLRKTSEYVIIRYFPKPSTTLSSIDCVRRLIDAGADVDCAYPENNRTIIHMTAYYFWEHAEDEVLDFEEGSVICTVRLLLEAGAPVETSALRLLQELQPVDDKVRRERDGLITLLQQERSYSVSN